jgi:ADP-heptose:LPS heptosyltransferase
MESFARTLASRVLNAMTTPQLARAVGSPLYFLAGRRAGKETSLKSARAILVLCPDEIGNVVLATPFLRELRRNAPGGWITLVVKPEVFNLVELCPYVDEVVTFDWRVSGRAGALKRHARALRLAASRLWRRRFDLALLPRWDADHYHSTYLIYFSGASRRVGYSEHVLRRKQQINAGFDRMLTDAFPDTSAVHEVEQYLEVLRFLGGEAIDDRLELWLDAKDRSLVRQLLAQHGMAREDGVIALAPGASAPRKCWPVERFVELGRLLVREYDARFVAVGGPQDTHLGQRLETELGSSRVLNLAGRTTLRQTAAVLERCCLTVSNDSGPMHLAAAVGSPVVEIAWHPCGGSPADPDSPARFHPWGVPHVVVQPERATDGCRDSCESSEPHCILGVETGKVWAAARGLLAAGARVGTAAGNKQCIS